MNHRIAVDRLHLLNRAPADAARANFLGCCGSTQWANRMAAGRPYPSLEALLEQADRVWGELTSADWIEAFRRHPRIGEAGGSWSREEQAGTQDASPDTLAALDDGNRAYGDRFGFIFLICATGKSAAEMLRCLRERLNNDRDRELQNAASEQRLITRIRLRKLLAE